MTMPPRLALAHISKSFPGVKANEDISLSVRPGEIHALLGENGAGKSTLVKIIYGVQQADEGTISWNGAPGSIPSPKAARKLGIGMVFQHFSLFDAMTVIENIALGLDEAVDRETLKREVAGVLESYSLPLDPEREVHTLSVGERQRIEIVRCLLQKPKLLIMDEPTSVLTPQEVDRLFATLRQIAMGGCAILYISHKLHEIKALCDSATILRGGKVVATCDPKVESTKRMAELMIGAELRKIEHGAQAQAGAARLVVSGLSLPGDPPFGTDLREVSFEARAGEILGIAGLVGAKRTDIVETLFGIREKSAGTITLHGKKINNHNANEAINHGFALVTEERRSTGIYAYLDIGFNSLISNIRNYKNKVGLLDNSRMKSDTQWVIDSMRVKTQGHRTQIGSLSGGNQQKVIIGRWLLTQPEILMLDEPTRGIDVGAKFEIYQLIAELAKKGKGIIIISSEMPELLGITDRILVMSNGLVSGIVDTKTTTQNEILRLASLHL